MFLGVGQIDKNTSQNDGREGCHGVDPEEHWLFFALKSFTPKHTKLAILVHCEITPTPDRPDI